MIITSDFVSAFTELTEPAVVPDSYELAKQFFAPLDTLIERFSENSNALFPSNTL